MAGYIGTTPVPQATQHRESFTATGGQTSFATVGYTPQFIDVYLNGVKLAPADFTATNGSDVVLASGATASDILEIVAYTPFEVANQTFTGTTTAANLTVTGAFTSQGIDDNADAVAITIDSSENVGIGTSSPATLMHLSGTSEVIRIEDTDATLAANQTIGKLEFYSNDASGAGVGVKASVKALAEDTIGRTSLVFSTADSSSNDTEAMRIDSSGRLLQGSTSANMGIGNTTTGSQLSDYIVASRTAGAADQAAAYFNKNSLDGDIVQFRKDGTTVGSIGTRSGSIGIGNGDVGLEFNASNNDIYPKNVTTNSLSDANIDLGSGSYRFKDLYLSGGVYLGGTGSANKLDDYEFGAWTPTINDTGGTGTTSYVNQLGQYVKIGNLVHVNFYISGTWTATPTGDGKIEGLPFTVYNKNTYPSVQGAIGYAASGSEGKLYLYAHTDTTELPIGVMGTGSLTAASYSTNMSTTNFQMHIGLTYQTSA